MSTKTTNLELIKPDGTDAPDILYINNNMDKIDSAYKDLQDDMKEVFQSVSNGKALVASAITDMGVETASDATFQTMDENIRQIKSGGEDMSISNSQGELFKSAEVSQLEMPTDSGMYTINSVTASLTE